MYRVFVGGIRHESNSFSTLIAKLEDFTITRGEKLLENVGKFFEGKKVEVIPSLIAYARPSGLVEEETYLRLRDEILVKLEESKPVDGVYLDLHGAMEVENLGSGDLDLVEKVREIVGDETLISVSFDLHGNIPEKLVDLVDVVVAYRHAPHIDAEETRFKAVNLLYNLLKTGEKTSKAIIKPPVMLPGEYFVTLIEPAKSFMKKLWVIDEDPDIIVSSFLIGCAWTDAPHSRASSIVIAKEKAYEKALEKAKELAWEYWKLRREFRLDVESEDVEEIMLKASREKVKPVVVSDSGDNVTAGGGGDVPVVLDTALNLGLKDVLIAGFYDKESFERCREAGLNNTVNLKLGGKVDKVNGYPVRVGGKVIKLTSSDALVRVGEIDIIVSRVRKPYVDLGSYQELGIDPRNYKIVVVKVGYLHSDIRDIAAKAYMALTPGFTDLRIEKLPYKNIIRPVYPIDKDFEWSPY